MNFKYQFSPKLGKSSFIDYEELAKNRIFEIGFQIQNKEVPDSVSDETIPPIEFYDEIAANFDQENYGRLLEVLNNFATYLFKNGLDDIEEFDNSRMKDILMSLCESKNSDISQSAFHIITLLQSKGPAYPDFFFDVPFFNFCFSFISQKYSVVLYYSLIAIYNICCQSDQSRNYIYSQIPIDKIKSLFTHHDINVKEAALTLSYIFLKCSNTNEYVIEILNIVKNVLKIQDKPPNENEDNEIEEKDKPLVSYSFWILVGILRYHPELTNEIMCEQILRRTNYILDLDPDSDCAIPGFIFISYVYEMQFEIPDFDYAGFLNIFEKTNSQKIQVQAYTTMNKIFNCRPDLISKFIQYGLIIQTEGALNNAKYADKITIGIIVCNAMLKDIGCTCDRVLSTGSISFFLDLIDIEDDELTKLALTCIISIFDEADKEDRVNELKEPFFANEGPEMLSNLEQGENTEISMMIEDFRNKYFSNDGVDEEEDADEPNEYM